MKRTILMFAFLLISAVVAYSQEASSVVVMLKNGTIVTGKVKQFDPTTKIVLNVGGIDTTINMSDVSSVTSTTEEQTTVTGNEATTKRPNPTINLPEDTIVNICGVNVKFILMKGGKFKYGFNGRGSLSMDSEPVHDVVLSPYYISEELVSKELYQAVMNKPYPVDFNMKYDDKSVNDESIQSCAFFMTESLVKMKRVPALEEFMQALQGRYKNMFDIPTEVQWFYSENRKIKETTRLKTPTYLYCQFAKQVSMSDVYDPVGRSIVVKGSTKHTKRNEIETYRLYDRSQTKTTNIEWWGKSKYVIYKRFSGYHHTLCPIRLVMQVKQ